MEGQKGNESMPLNEAWADFYERHGQHVTPKPTALLMANSMVERGKSVGYKQMINQMEQHAPGCYELDLRIRRIKETPDTD